MIDQNPVCTVCLVNDRNELIYFQRNSYALSVDDRIHYQYANLTLRVIIVYTNILGIIKLVHTDTRMTASPRRLYMIFSILGGSVPGALRRSCNGESEMKIKNIKKKQERK